jgi:membrane peptidoglycan carboxypeptidase
MLEGVIQRGTAARLKSLGRPLAGKTGTTNESKDTWFIGFSPDLVVGVFVGFDEPKSLGKRETGSSVAAPIWGDFMKEALADELPMPFRVPPGIKNIRVNAKTGRLASADDANVIWEAFLPGTEPNVNDYVLNTNVIDGSDMIDPYGDDPYGYNRYGYGDTDNTYDNPPNGYGEYPAVNNNANIYGNENVEVYGLPSSENDGSLSYFSQQRREQEAEGNIQFNNPPNSERILPPATNAPIDQQPPSRPSQETAQPQQPNFTGTGGLY